MSAIFSFWTVIVFIFFIGVVIWVMSDKRKQDFEEAANIPFLEKDELKTETSQEKSNG